MAPLATVDWGGDLSQDGADTILWGIDAGDRAGLVVARAGDVNLDGLDDVLVAAPFRDGNGESSGEVVLITQVVEGEQTLWSAGIPFSGGHRDLWFAETLVGAGDVDGDGWPDLVLDGLVFLGPFEAGPTDAPRFASVQVWDACGGELVVDADVGGDAAFSLEDDSLVVPEGEEAVVVVRFDPPDAELHQGLLLLRTHDGDPVYASLEARAEGDWDGDGHPALLASGEDCDDDDASVFPGAEERCDGVDQDCDGQVDEEPVDGVTLYADRDQDGLGDSTHSAVACPSTPGWSTDATDCDDLSASIGPPPEGEDCPLCPVAHQDAVVCTALGSPYGGIIQIGAESGRWCLINEAGGSRDGSEDDGYAMAWDGETATWCAQDHYGTWWGMQLGLVSAEVTQVQAMCRSITRHGSGLLVWNAKGSPLRWYTDLDHLVDGDYGATHAVYGVPSARFASTGTQILAVQESPPEVLVFDRVSGDEIASHPIDSIPQSIAWTGAEIVLNTGSALLRLDPDTGEVLGEVELPFSIGAIDCEAGLWSGE